MDGDKKFLVEKLAEYADRNRFTLEELGRLIRLCLQLERDCPGVQFIIPEGNAFSVERALRRQAQSSQWPTMSQEEFNRARAWKAEQWCGTTDPAAPAGNSFFSTNRVTGRRAP